MIIDTKQEAETDPKRLSFSQRQELVNKNRSIVTKIFVILVILATLGIPIYLIYSRKNASVVVVRKCSPEILREAASASDINQVTKLQQVADKVKATVGYQQDQNCLYIVLLYSINSGDPINARTNLVKFEKLHNSKKPLSQDLGPVKNKLTLESDVAFIEKGAKDVQNSAETFGNHP